MADESGEASFSINLDTDAGEVSGEAAAELEKLRQTIHGSQDAVKQMSASLRALRGTSDEVKSAKAQLKAKIESERDAISASNLALLKQGTTFEKLSSQTRKAALEQTKLTEALKAEELKKTKAQADGVSGALQKVGGPLAELKGKFDSLKDVVGGAGGKMGLLVGAAALATAALVALVVAAGAAVISFVKFVVGAADAARNMNILREAMTGSAQNATNLGTQVDALAGKVSTSKEALNTLAASLGRTRLSGQAIVDTFNLVGRAADAMGDDVGNQLKDIVTRGQITKRLQINPAELQGTGLKFQDVAAALAVQMKVGVKQAQQALFEGRVKLDDGAKALRTAVEKRFGEINAKKLLSLDVIVAKFHERLSSLASNVNIEPLLKGFAELSKLFDSSTVSGATLKGLVTIIGNGIGPAFQAVLPIAKGFIKGLIIGALDVAIAFLTLKNGIKKTFGGGDAFAGLDLMKISLNAAKFAIYGVATGLAIVAAAIGAVVLVTSTVVDAFKALGKSIAGVWDAIGFDWKGIGSSVVDGIISGLKAGATGLVDAVKGLASSVKGAFTGALEMRSPSKVFKGYGVNLGESVGLGVEKSTPAATGAVDDMAAAVSTSGAGASSGVGARGGASAPSIVLQLYFNVTGGADAKRELSDPSFLAQVTKAIEDALRGAGVPTQGVVAS